MNQPSLFDAPAFSNRAPIAANVDPLSSHLAAQEITRSGRRGAQKRAVLEALKAAPERTSAELARFAGLDRYAVARRLPDLAHDGFAEQGPMRKCRITGRPAVTWKPIVEGDNAAQ